MPSAASAHAERTHCALPLPPPPRAGAGRCAPGAEAATATRSGAPTAVLGREACLHARGVVARGGGCACAHTRSPRPAGAKSGAAAGCTLTYPRGIQSLFIPRYVGMRPEFGFYVRVLVQRTNASRMCSPPSPRGSCSRGGGAAPRRATARRHGAAVAWRRARGGKGGRGRCGARRPTKHARSRGHGTRAARERAPALGAPFGRPGGGGEAVSAAFPEAPAQHTRACTRPPRLNYGVRVCACWAPSSVRCARGHARGAARAAVRARCWRWRRGE